MPRGPVDETTQVFAEGFFEVLGAVLSVPVTFEADPCARVTPEEAVQALDQWPLVLEGRAQSGAAALLLTAKDGLRLSGMVFGNADKASDQLAEHDLATLTEFCEHAMKRAFERVAARGALELNLTEAKVSFEGPVSEARLGPVLAADAQMAGLRFSASPDLDVEAVLLLPTAWAVEAAAPAKADPVPAVENPKKELRMAPDSDRDFGRSAGNGQSNPANLDMVLDIRLVVRARLGRIELPIGDILGLGPGSIVDIGRMLDDPVEVLVNDKLIARGDVVVVDEKFGLRITEIVSPVERIESLR
jgi:flagellar motor switch protein FliN/FliY